MNTPNLDLTPTEWTVIKAIWELEPCTAPQVLAAVQATTDWSYSTVRTIMDRMAVKGLLMSRKEGKLTKFRSSVSRTEAQRSEILYALKHVFDGALTPMVQCLLESGKITAREVSELEQLLKTRKPRSGQ